MCKVKVTKTRILLQHGGSRIFFPGTDAVAAGFAAAAAASAAAFFSYCSFTVVEAMAAAEAAALAAAPATVKSGIAYA